MPAIVRQTLSRTLARQFLEDVINSSNEYYIGIGKSDIFPTSGDDVDHPYTPIDGSFEEREFRHNLQSIKKVEGAIFVAPRVNWNANDIYDAWSDNVDADEATNFFVMNSAKEVYLCLEQGTRYDGQTIPSTVEPNYCELNVDYKKPFRTADNYVWKFLFALTPQNIYQYLSTNHIPVGLTGPTSKCNADGIEDLQLNVMNAAVGGEILRGEVISGGAGYTQESTTIEVKGDGTTTATAEVIVYNGSVVGVRMIDFGAGYTEATFKIEGANTEPCVVRAVITPPSGLGADPVDDLKTSSVLLNIKPDGKEGNTFIVENTFRQIGVIKNPLTPEGQPYTQVSGKVMSSLTLSSSSPYKSGDVIYQENSGARAYVNESVDEFVFYHQNESTGFIPFDSNEAVTDGTTSSSFSVFTDKYEIDRHSGDVLYIENRSRIRRDAEQQEDIKVVITI